MSTGAMAEHVAVPRTSGAPSLPKPPSPARRPSPRRCRHLSRLPGHRSSATRVGHPLPRPRHRSQRRIRSNSSVRRQVGHASQSPGSWRAHVPSVRRRPRLSSPDMRGIARSIVPMSGYLDQRSEIRQTSPESLNASERHEAAPASVQRSAFHEFRHTARTRATPSTGRRRTSTATSTSRCR